MIKKLSKLLGWATWFFLYFCVRLPLILVGLVLFPLMYWTRNKDTNKLAKIFWIWDNEEDGIYGAPFWWERKYGGVKDLKTAYTWSALRNPVNNMRFVFGVNRDKWKKNYFFYGDKEIPHPRLAREKGGKVWHLSYIKVGILYLPSFWYIKSTGPDTHFRIRAGWKCTWDWIEDQGLSKTGKYSGFALQFLPKRKG